MEFTGLAVGTYAVIIEDTVGDIGGFLNFGYEIALAYSMNASCR